MKEIQTNRTFSWLEWRRPIGTGHSSDWHPGHPQEQVIQVAGMVATQRDRHSVVWNSEDPEVENIQLAGMQDTQRNRTFSWLE